MTVKRNNGFVRAILIDPEAQTISEMFLHPDLQGLYYPLKHADSHFSGIIDAVSLSAFETMYVDDEGCLSPGRAAFSLNGNMFAGAAIIVGTDDEGETVSTRLPLGLIEGLTAFPDLETSGDFTETTEEENANMPFGGKGFVIHGGKPIYRERNAKNPD